MSLYNSFDRSKLFSELNLPDIGTATGTISPSLKKATARSNLGTFAASDGVTNARFGAEPMVAQPTPTAVDATATLTAASLLARMITSVTTAAVTATLPTGTQMDTAALAQYSALAVNDSIEVAVINTGASNAWTLTAATGFTIIGNAVVNALTSAKFRLRRTAANTWVAYRIA